MTDQKKVTILIADNDEDLLNVLVRRLEGWGYCCETARSGDEGLAVFEGGGVDLVITDLNMPGMDGVEFLRRVRELSDAPVIVMTGYEKDLCVETWVQSGCHGFA